MSPVYFWSRLDLCEINGEDYSSCLLYFVQYFWKDWNQNWTIGHSAFLEPGVFHSLIILASNKQKKKEKLLSKKSEMNCGCWINLDF